MNKLQKKMIRAIETRKNVSLGNTSINTAFPASGEEITVCVHGALIATFFPEKGRVLLTDNFGTFLHLRRVNALLGYFCKKGYSVVKRKGGSWLKTPEGFNYPIDASTQHIPSIPTLIY